MRAIDNKQLLERIFEGLADRDGRLLTGSMADDVCWRVIGTTTWSGSFTGKDAVLRELLAPLRQNLAQRSRTVAQRVLTDGDFVVVEARGDNETRRALRYDNTYCFVFRLTGGKIVEITEYCDTDLVARVLEHRSAAVG
jgi:uncharacterized protein